MKKNLLLASIFLVFLLLKSNCISAQIALVPFINDVTKVTDITNCGDDRLFIVEQAGKIRISDLNGNLQLIPFLSISNKVNDSGNEQGLLGIAFSPNYLSDGRFYVNYTNNTNETVIARYHVLINNPNEADSLNEEILFKVAQPYTNHNGGSIHFGPDGYLYIGFGDGGAGGDPGNRAQNLQVPLGKILRIDVNTLQGYRVPESNPFYGSPTANPLIWAYGVRNPWRISFDRLTGDLWIGDVGQNVLEEIDFQPASSLGGENYGWRCYEANSPYDSTCNLPLTSYVPPVYTYPHFPDCSVTGGYVYRGARYAALYGKYFFTDYCSGNLRSLTPTDTGGFTLKSHGFFGYYSYTTFGEDKYGELYLGKNTTGVFKMIDSSCTPVALISYQDTIFANGNSYKLTTPFARGLTYQWLLNGLPLAGASSNSYLATISGKYQVMVADSCVNFSKIITLVLNKGEGFEMYPNPTTNSTLLLWSSEFPQNKRLEVFNPAGQVVVNKEIDLNDLNYTLATSQYRKGIYFVRMTINEKVFMKKLVIK